MDAVKALVAERPFTGELCVRLIDVAAAATDATGLGGATPLILSALAFFSLSLAAVCAPTFSAALAEVEAEMGIDSRALA